MERIWIYQSNRELSDEQVQDLKPEFEAFVKRWAAHSKKLAADFEIRFNRFLILKVDEAEYAASGCSIDESVRFIKELESKKGLSLFDRSQVAYEKNGKVYATTLNQISKLYHQGEINDNTPVFDNTITSSSELKSKWQQPLKESGYYKFV
jgi:hypothetical protein